MSARHPTILTLTILASILSGALTNVSMAATTTILWHPSSPLYLGATFDPDNPTEAKVPCLKNVSQDTISVDTGAPSTDFRSSIVRETRELYDQFSVSASMSASYGLTSGGGSVSALDEVQIDSQSVVWSLTAHSNFGRFALSKVELQDDYAKLDAASLEAICGTHFVSMERRESTVSAIFVFKSSSQKTRDELKASLNASWSGGSFSANVSSVLKKSLSETQVTFVFLARGGDGLTATSGFVTSFDQIDELRKQVASYIASMTKETAPAVEYTFAKLPIVPSITLMTDTRQRVLSNLWYDFLKYTGIQKEARHDLDNINDYWFIKKDVLAPYLTQIYSDASTKIDQLSQIAVACTADKAKCIYTPEISSSPPNWPEIDPVNADGGYNCVPAPKCNLIMYMYFMVSGPGSPDSIDRSLIVATFTGQSVGYNCIKEPIQTTSVGIKISCILGTDAGFDKSQLQYVLANHDTGKQALRASVVDSFPNYPLP